MSTLTQRSLIVILLALGLCGASLAGTERLEDYACYGELQKPLFEGGYVGGDCTNIKVQIKKVGIITVKGGKFTIFDLRYKTTHNPGAAHYGDRLIIINGNKTYVGQYTLTSAPYSNIYIRGTSIYLEGIAKELGNQISFEGGFPPDKAYLDGDVKELYK